MLHFNPTHQRLQPYVHVTNGPTRTLAKFQPFPTNRPRDTPDRKCSYFEIILAIHLCYFFNVICTPLLKREPCHLIPTMVICTRAHDKCNLTTQPSFNSWPAHTLSLIYALTFSKLGWDYHTRLTNVAQNFGRPFPSRVSGGQ